MNQRKIILVLLAFFILSSAIIAGKQMDRQFKNNHPVRDINNGITLTAVDDNTPKITIDPPLSSISVDETTIAPYQKRLEIAPNATHPLLEHSNQDINSTYSDMAVGNFSNDGIPDLVVVANNSLVLIIDGITGNTFDTINIQDPYLVATGEFTGDKFDDIVIASKSGTGNMISAYSGQDRSLLYTKQYGSPIRFLETGTFNVQQQDDITFLVGTDVVFLEGATGADLYLTLGVSGATGLVADVTADGIDDVILSENADLWVINGSDGQIIDDVTGGQTPNFLASADVTGDGKAEIFYDQNSELIVYNVATSTNVYSKLFDTANFGIDKITTAELNGDLIEDIVIGLQNGTIVSLSGNNGTVMSKIFVNQGSIQVLQAGNFDTHPGNEIVVGIKQTGILYLNGSNLARLHTSSLDQNNILGLSFADFNNDSIDDIVVADGSLPTSLSFIYADNHAPVVNFIELPRVRTTDSELSFSIFFDEPNIDTVSFSYGSTIGEIQTINIDQPSTKLLNFRVFSQERKLSFWFHLNDTSGLSTDVGTISDPYSIALFDNTIWSSQKADITQFTDIAFLKISDNGVKDVVGLSDTGFVSFFNGTTGELLYDNAGLNDFGEKGFMEIADFNSDGIDDVILAGYNTFSGLLVIDGSTGLTIATQSDGTIYRGLTVGDFVAGGGLDIAVLSQNTISFFGTNLVPEGSIDSNLIGGGAVQLTKMDYNNDGEPDLVVIGENANLLVFDSVTKELLLNFDMAAIDGNIVDYDLLVIGDINNDGIDDIVGKTTANPDISHTFAINGNSGIEGELLFSAPMNGVVADLNLADYNNDKQLDVVSLSNYGPQDRPEITIISASGNILYNDTISGLTDDVPLAGNIALADISRDGQIDFILQLDSGIYIVDGRTGGLLEIISEDSQANVGNIDPKDRPRILVEDTDNNGLLDIAYIQQNQINLRQSLYSIKALRVIPTMETAINQTAGPKQIFLQLLDFYGDPVVDASVSLLLTRANDTIRNTLATIINKDGLYQATLSPESYDIGKWNMMPIIDHPIYQNIRISSYEDQRGNLVPFFEFGVRGVLDPSYLVSSKGAYFDAQTGLVSGVVEGNSIQLKVTVQDVFAHKIGNDAVNITVEFAGTSYQAQYPNAPHIMELSLDTTGMTFGLYSIVIRFNGDYVYGTTSTFLKIDLIPQQPKLDLSPAIIVGIALLSFLFFSFVLKQQNDIYSSLGTDPGEVYSSIRSAIIAMIALLVIFIGLGVTIGNSSNNRTTSQNNNLLTPLMSFIFLLGALLIVLILVLMWHFRLTLKQYYALEFKMRSIIMTLFLSIVVGVLLAGIIIFGSQVQWIKYQMELNSITIPIINQKIPQIIWQITVTGFLTGFLYILFLDSYDTYSDIKELLNIEKRVLDGFYPKEPSKLYDSITIEAKSTFISLSKGFLLWYAVILWSVINGLQLIGIVSTPLLAFVLPFLIASSIFFRSQLLAILGISDTKDTLETDTKE